MNQETIGDRIKRFRGSAFTQKELAEAAELSVDLVRKLEQNQKLSCSIKTLHKLARALDIDVAELVGKRSGIPSGDLDAGVVAIRQALSPVDDLVGDIDEAEPLSLEEAQKDVTYAWGSYWSGRYEKLSAILPPGITRLRATARHVSIDQVPKANELYAWMLWVSACTLVHLGQTDPAWIAIRQAHEAAQKGNDPFLEATLRGSVGWQLLVQGRYEESRRVVLKAASDLAPQGDVPQQHLAVHGSLILQGATAAGRDQRVSEALDLAQEASEIASRLGIDTNWYECNFGPSQVVMQTTDINVSTERYPEALEVAKTMPNRGAGLTQVSRARHLLDQAAAAARSEQYQRALDLLLTAEQVGGKDWVRYQTLLKSVVSELLAHDRQNPLRDFAHRVGVSA
ncbi:helix-turn-helix domain-containing protein [Nocardia terpenica]|uniref:Transcriptional regulator n=1 Tax=Nocardia terpenica TaxID=455432 RepID=A0A164H3F4_9NOCA|nr:helix-turn-helix transcriptional regulator [Nocardia terpenica]KZM68168.1 transcriptional regulator [Nocardia terpenica]NQE88972.1 helix-turn-helix transcriptional regulator [Nocardia terpenica]